MLPVTHILRCLEEAAAGCDESVFFTRFEVVRELIGLHHCTAFEVRARHLSFRTLEQEMFAEINEVAPESAVRRTSNHDRVPKMAL